ncbi:MAG: hypothetical protein ACREDR_31270, partial [Blastocatellia bacterium]
AETIYGPVTYRLGYQSLSERESHVRSIVKITGLNERTLYRHRPPYASRSTRPARTIVLAFEKAAEALNAGREAENRRRESKRLTLLKKK